MGAAIRRLLAVLLLTVLGLTVLGLTVLLLTVLRLPIRLLTVSGLILRLLIRLLLWLLVRTLLWALVGGRWCETGSRLLAHAADLVLHRLVLHRSLRRILNRWQRRRHRRVRGRTGLVRLRLVRQIMQGVTGRGSLLLGWLRLTLRLLRLIRCRAHPRLLTGSPLPIVRLCRIRHILQCSERVLAQKAEAVQLPQPRTRQQ
ncbi:hypothetical protein [Actinocrinis sp.]|uniref:hypothetical protein n=1 Tax=Actinocrinis sp. TaxID=1920516 RepID=UPI002B7701F5|nr:hypothetical protein [Actinocrinis sp.]HXR70189.1 hypothetical protein [Actinocrinis sp.]